RQVIGVAKLKKSAGVVRVQLDSTFHVLDSLGAFALGQVDASELEVIFGAVGAQFLQFGQKLPGVVQIAYLAINAGSLELHLGRSVTRLFRPLEGFEGLVELLARSQSPTEVKVGQRPFGLLEVLNGVLRVPEEIEGNAELQVPFLRLGGCRHVQPLLEQVRHVAQSAVLGS